VHKRLAPIEMYRDTGALTRRSEWFVTKTPEVRRDGTRIKYLISFVLPRFCEQTLDRSWKAELYGRVDLGYRRGGYRGRAGALCPGRRQHNPDPGNPTRYGVDGDRS